MSRVLYPPPSSLFSHLAVSKVFSSSAVVFFFLLFFFLRFCSSLSQLCILSGLSCDEHSVVFDVHYRWDLWYYCVSLRHRWYTSLDILELRAFVHSYIDRRRFSFLFNCWSRRSQCEVTLRCISLLSFNFRFTIRAWCKRVVNRRDTTHTRWTDLPLLFKPIATVVHNPDKWI